jgi:hypothetical protein
MRSQFVGLRQASAVRQQAGDGAVSAGRAEVGNSPQRFVSNVHSPKILRDHQPDSSVLQFREEEVIETKVGEPQHASDETG